LPECGGAGSWERCPDHGSGNCPCYVDVFECETCDGKGHLPTVCSEGCETVVPRAGMACADCARELLLEAAAKLPYVVDLDAQIDRVTRAAIALDEALKLVKGGENLASILADDEVA
jgi:hypothetical protein